MTIHSISTPPEWESDNDWDSHRPALYYAINTIPHDTFYEFGMGYGSTPLLAIWYKNLEKGKVLNSFETNKEWFDKFIEGYKEVGYNFSFGFPVTIYRSANHTLLLSENYLKWNLAPNSIAFIDSAPGEQRKDLIVKNANRAKALIVHDTEPGAEYVYGMASILDTFKYRLDYAPEGMPRTTIVSKFIDVTQWLIP